MTAPAPAQTGQELTDRETQCLRGALNGCTNAQIAFDLFLAEDTVKTHLRRAYRKLGAKDRPHAVALALRAGVLTLAEVRPTCGTPGPPQAPQRAVQRARRLLADWRRSGGPPPASHLAAHWWDHKLTQLATAINDQQESTP